jgi:hypothetical protein
MADRTPEILFKISRETGRPFYVVKRVYNLIVEVSQHDALLTLVDGEVVAVSMEEDDGRQLELPSDLRAKIDKFYDDVAELVEPINRALHKLVIGTADYPPPRSTNHD